MSRPPRSPTARPSRNAWISSRPTARSRPPSCWSSSNRLSAVSARPRPSIWRVWPSAATVSRSTMSPICEPRELADRGVRFIKVPASLLLDPKQTSSSDIHPSDLSDLLGRFGIDLIAEKIEGERAVVDLLDYDVRFGQGFLFAPPRPLRPEGANGSVPVKGGEAGAPKPTPAEAPTADPTMRATGNAALARRVAGPG